MFITSFVHLRYYPTKAMFQTNIATLISSYILTYQYNSDFIAGRLSASMYGADKQGRSPVIDNNKELHVEVGNTKS